jgi:hypothetical protein
LQVLVKDGGEWKIAAYHRRGRKERSGGARTAVNGGENVVPGSKLR